MEGTRNFDRCTITEFLLAAKMTLQFDVDILRPKMCIRRSTFRAGLFNAAVFQRQLKRVAPSSPPVRQIRPSACSWSSSSKTAPSFFAARSFIFVIRRQRFW